MPHPERNISPNTLARYLTEYINNNDVNMNCKKFMGYKCRSANAKSFNMRV